jgi:hypothetical protein
MRTNRTEYLFSGADRKEICDDGRTSPVVGASSNELSELRLHDDGADLAAALDLLVGCGGLV